MARPIADTPVLRGQDAVRFMEAMAKPTPVSVERRQEIEESYQWAKSIATFAL